MKVLNYSLLRKNLKDTLDAVAINHETVIINRGEDNVVMIPLSKYNSWTETEYLMSSEENKKRLLAAIEDEKKN